MDVGCSLNPFAASTMTPQCHSGPALHQFSLFFTKPCHVQQTKGAAICIVSTAYEEGLYNRLTRNSTHYVVLYALFIEGEVSQDQETTHRIILLGVSPMIGIKDKKDAATANENENENKDNSTDAADEEECNQLSYLFVQV
jgi:hypothetical protein